MQGLLGTDKQLAAAIWRTFFTFDCQDLAHLETLVKYIRIQVILFSFSHRMSQGFDKVIALFQKRHQSMCICIVTENCEGNAFYAYIARRQMISFFN